VDPRGTSLGNGTKSDQHNSGLATTVNRVGTASNPMQANIRPKPGGWNIRKKESDNDAISSVSSESSTDTPLIVNNNCSTMAPGGDSPSWK
jgi:hypothetical protein